MLRRVEEAAPAPEAGLGLRGGGGALAALGSDESALVEATEIELSMAKEAGACDERDELWSGDTHLDGCADVFGDGGWMATCGATAGKHCSSGGGAGAHE